MDIHQSIMGNRSEDQCNEAPFELMLSDTVQAVFQANFQSKLQLLTRANERFLSIDKNFRQAAYVETELENYDQQ